MKLTTKILNQKYQIISFQKTGYNPITDIWSLKMAANSFMLK